MAAVKAEQEEWYSIRDEKIAAGQRPTAYQVTLEQKKRMMARGQVSPTLAFLKEHT